MKTKFAYILTPIGVLFFLFLLSSFFNIGLPVRVTTTMKSTELSVTGEGKVEVVPDTAYVDLGIQVSNVSTVEQAQQQINTTNNAIIEAMNTLGIEKKNIKTSNYSIYPNYNYEGGQNTITGYNGNVTLTIQTETPAQVSDVIAQATAAGANEVQNTRFEVKDPAKYRAEARSKAIDNAKEQAQKIAGDLGIRLGKVVNVVEQTSGSSAPVPLYDSRAMGLGGGGGGANLEPGSQNITSVVTLYFEKK